MTTFFLSEGRFTPAGLYLTGDPPANAAQVPDVETLPVALNGSSTLNNTVTLNGQIPDQAGNPQSSLFAALPVTADSLPPDDFEVLASGNLPAGWPTSWTDSKGGGAWQYDSGGRDSFSGNSVLRLHVGAGGGFTFVLSDPVNVSPNQFYAFTVQMRYYLTTTSEAVCFTVLQYDAAGNEIAINELDGIAGDNYWTWKRKALSIHTHPDAASIRIRFGLISSTESYLDVDALK